MPPVQPLPPGLDAGVLTMFSTPWCGYCTRLKLLLKSEGVPLVVVDIEQDPAAEAYVLAVNGDGTATVPVITFPDGSTAVNPRFAEVKDRLAATA
jgi:mycoredoxin